MIMVLIKVPLFGCSLAPSVAHWPARVYAADIRFSVRFSALWGEESHTLAVWLARLTPGRRRRTIQA